MSEESEEKIKKQLVFPIEAAALSMEHFETVRSMMEQRGAFFDRLTLGCGATITALVSFVANQHVAFKPAGVLKSALFSLLVAMCLGLLRTLSGNGLTKALFFSLRTYEDNFETLTGNKTNAFVAGSLAPLLDEIDSDKAKEITQSSARALRIFASHEIFVGLIEVAMSIFVCRAAYELFRLVAWTF